MNTVPLSEAKATLSSLLAAVEGHEEEVVITRNGRAAAVLVTFRPGRHSRRSRNRQAAPRRVGRPAQLPGQPISHCLPRHRDRDRDRSARSASRDLPRDLAGAEEPAFSLSGWRTTQRRSRDHWIGGSRPPPVSLPPPMPTTAPPRGKAERRGAIGMTGAALEGYLLAPPCCSIVMTSSRLKLAAFCRGG